MSERDRGDRPKKTWRERDAQRGTPRPSRDERGDSRSSGMDARASKQYRAALDALFEKGEVGKIADKLSGGPGAGRVDPVDVVHGRPPPERPSPVAERSSSSERSSSEREPSAARAAPAPAAPPA